LSVFFSNQKKRLRIMAGVAEPHPVDRVTRRVGFEPLDAAWRSFPDAHRGVVRADVRYAIADLESGESIHGIVGFPVERRGALPDMPLRALPLGSAAEDA